MRVNVWLTAALRCDDPFTPNDEVPFAGHPSFLVAQIVEVKLGTRSQIIMVEKIQVVVKLV
jgi:predicted PhzF superfamily epimerase YddE/YHI9